MLYQKFQKVATGKGQSRGYRTDGLLVPVVYARDRLAARVIVFEVG